jgi:hypothetical protein
VKLRGHGAISSATRRDARVARSPVMDCCGFAVSGKAIESVETSLNAVAIYDCRRLYACSKVYRLVEKAP